MSAVGLNSYRQMNPLGSSILLSIMHPMFSLPVRDNPDDTQHDPTTADDTHTPHYPRVAIC
jgi:hypothetical protein